MFWVRSYVPSIRIKYHIYIHGGVFYPEVAIFGGFFVFIIMGHRYNIPVVHHVVPACSPTEVVWVAFLRFLWSLVRSSGTRDSMFGVVVFYSTPPASSAYVDWLLLAYKCITLGSSLYLPVHVYLVKRETPSEVSAQTGILSRRLVWFEHDQCCRTADLRQSSPRGRRRRVFLLLTIECGSNTQQPGGKRGFVEK